MAYDRINHIISSNVSAGLVWTIFKANKDINYLIELQTSFASKTDCVEK